MQSHQKGGWNYIAPFWDTTRVSSKEVLCFRAMWGCRHWSGGTLVHAAFYELFGTQDEYEEMHHACQGTSYWYGFCDVVDQRSWASGAVQGVASQVWQLYTSSGACLDQKGIHLKTFLPFPMYPGRLDAWSADQRAWQFHANVKITVCIVDEWSLLSMTETHLIFMLLATMLRPPRGSLDRKSVV